MQRAGGRVKVDRLNEQARRKPTEAGSISAGGRLKR